MENIATPSNVYTGIILVDYKLQTGETDLIQRIDTVAVLPKMRSFPQTPVLI